MPAATRWHQMQRNHSIATFIWPHIVSSPFFFKVTRNSQGESRTSYFILCFFLILYSLLMHLEVPAKRPKHAAFVVLNWIWVPKHRCLQRLWDTKQFFSCIHVWLCQACGGGGKKKKGWCMSYCSFVKTGFWVLRCFGGLPNTWVCVCVCHTLSKLLLAIVASCAPLLMRRTRSSAWKRRYSLFNRGGGQSGNEYCLHNGAGFN